MLGEAPLPESLRMAMVVGQGATCCEALLSGCCYPLYSLTSAGSEPYDGRVSNLAAQNGLNPNEGTLAPRSLVVRP